MKNDAVADEAAAIGRDPRLDASESLRRMAEAVRRGGRRSSGSWVIPEDQPAGSFTYKVVATDNQGSTQTWEPFKIATSQLRVIAGERPMAPKGQSMVALGRCRLTSYAYGCANCRATEPRAARPRECPQRRVSTALAQGW